MPPTEEVVNAPPVIDPPVTSLIVPAAVRFTALVPAEIGPAIVIVPVVAVRLTAPVEPMLPTTRLFEP